MQPLSSDRPTVSRLAPIEGVRAYLAVWVFICHVLWWSGYQADALIRPLRILARGHFAVDVFIIVSGFVIFLLLDSKKETYSRFIVRRLFRLLPLFLMLFLLAIPLSRLMLWNLSQAVQFMTPDQIDYQTTRISSWWQNIPAHILLHATMLHGTVPQSIVEYAPDSFLQPGWSISLEWQFYLIAPLAYTLAIGTKPFHRIGICILAVVVSVASRSVPQVHHGAALPFHAEFFFFGAASYFLYKRYSLERLSDIWFPISCTIAVFLFCFARSNLPVCLWIVLLGLLFEHPSSMSSKLVLPLLNNPLAQFLGRISYSIYLSHTFVIVLLHYPILRLAPHLNQATHCIILLGLTTPITIIVSAASYRFIELPGIRLGQFLALGSKIRITATPAPTSAALQPLGIEQGQGLVSAVENR